jgi:hypothetical protein
MRSGRTGANVGVTLWIVGEGRYEPQNFPSFRIKDSEIVWDYFTQSSNYASIRQYYEQQSGEKAWELESSQSLNVPYFTQLVDYGGQSFPQYGYEAGADYDPAQTADGGTEAPEQVRADDLATLFHGIAPTDLRVTRIRADLARTALAQDLVLQASADQSPLTNMRYPTQSINKPPCPTFQPCPNGEGGIDGYVDATGGGCAVAPSDGSFTTITLAGLVAMVVRGRLARRRKR